jgi:hypothetical protein
MTGIQISIIVLGAVNVLGCMCRTDAMTWRTHKWAPQLFFMALGLLATFCGYLGALGVDLEFPVCAQLAVSVALLHTLPEYRNGTPLAAWRESRLRELQRDER